MTAINSGQMPAFRTPPPPHPAESALRELARDIGVPSDFADMNRIKLIIAGDRCRLQAEVHRLEATLGVLRAHTVPTLRGELQRAQSTADEWADRAKRAERTLTIALAIVVALGTITCIAVSVGIGR